MLISFLLPDVDRGSGPLHAWVMLAQMAAFEPEEIGFLGDDRYFAEEGVPFGERLIVGGHSFVVPSRSRFRRYRKRSVEFPSHWNAEGHGLALFRRAIAANDPSVAEHLATLACDIANGRRIAAFLSWINCASLGLAAKTLGVPVIHNELGPLRAPDYGGTVYFDFLGVNGRTTPSTWRSGNTVGAALRGIRLVSEKKLRVLVSGQESLEGVPDATDVGVAMQVEDDSNLVAFGNGTSSIELLDAARRDNPGARLRVRNHPASHFKFTGGGLGIVDDSANAREFLGRVASVYAVNSSVLTEAMLWGVPFRALGDCPVRPFAIDGALASWARDHRDLAINAFMLGYLVPSALLFDPDYYGWRLAGRRSLAACHERHLAQWQSTSAQRRRIVPASVPSAPKALLAVATGGGSDWLRNRRVELLIQDLHEQLLRANREIEGGACAASQREQALRDHLAEREAAVAWLEGQRTSLQSALSEKDAAEQALREHLAEREAAVAWLEGQRTSLQAALSEKDAAEQALRDHLAEREAAVTWLEGQRTSLQSALSEKDAAEQALRDHLAEREAAVAWLEGQRTSLQSALSEKDAAEQALRDHLAEREAAVTWLEGQRTSLQAALSEKDAAEQALREHVAEREAAVSWLEGQRTSLQAALSEKDAAEQALREHVAEREAAMAWLEGQRTSLQAALSEKDAAEQALHEHLAEREAAVSWLEGQRTSLQAALSEKDAAEQALREHVAEREAAMAWLEGQRTSLQAALSERAAAEQALREHVAEREAAVAWLEGQRTSLQAALDAETGQRQCREAELAVETGRATLALSKLHDLEASRTVRFARWLRLLPTTDVKKVGDGT